MDALAAISASDTSSLQQAVQVSVLKKAMDSQGELAAKLLAGPAGAAGAGGQNPSPPGVGTLVDRYA